MNKLFAIIFLISILMGIEGCSAVAIGGVEFYSTSWSNVSIVHKCTDYAVIYNGERVLAKHMGAAPVRVPLVAYSGGDYATITVNSIDVNGRVSETFMKTFNLNNREREPAWCIGKNKDCEGAKKHSRCN